MYRRRGMKFFDNEKYEDAKREFDDAILLKWSKEEDKAGAYAGLGMYYAIKGDEDKAEDNAKEALSLNDKLPLAHVCFGRTIMYLNKGKDADEWIDDAFDYFDDAIELAEDETNALNRVRVLSQSYYFKGIAAKMAYRFGEAKSAFAECVKLKLDPYAEKADKQWEIVQMIERAKPGTKVGAKVALMDKVGRAEIAVLFVEELKINMILDKKEKKKYNTGYVAPKDPMKYEADKLVKAESYSDAKGHWAASWIKDVMDKGIMEAMPDHTFQPDHKITRAEYAQMLLRVLVLVSNDESLYTKHFGEESSMFPDIRSDHFAYNALAVCATRGILKAEMNGEIGFNKSVSGAEALLIIRQFQHALTMTF